MSFTLNEVGFANYAGEYTQKTSIRSIKSHQ